MVSKYSYAAFVAVLFIGIIAVAFTTSMDKVNVHVGNTARTNLDAAIVRMNDVCKAGNNVRCENAKVNVVRENSIYWSAK